MLRKRSLIFLFFYYLFLPLSYPLTLIAGVISRLTGQDGPSVETMFGRTRMFRLIASGKRDGILTQIQARMADNLMNSGGHTLAGMVESPDGIPEASESADREAVLALAEGSARVFLHPEGKPQEWTGCVRVATLLLSELTPTAAREPLPRFTEDTQPLVALAELFRQHAHFGIVLDESRIVGIIRRDVLSDQLLMSQKSSAAPKAAWEL